MRHGSHTPEWLAATHLALGDSELSGGRVQLTADGLIGAVEASALPPETPPSMLTPAFLDLHTHGALGHDVMSATPSGLAEMQRFLARCGVAYYLPTTVTAALDPTLRALEHLGDAVERGPQPGEAQPIGLHLEGPFLSHAKRGVHPTEHLQRPSVALFERFYEAARGHILLLTLAPELPGALELIAHARGKGVRVSLGHSDATAAQTLAALETGATGATHTFNAMRALDHREPGILGTVLDDSRVFAELICDGVHVAPPLVRLWLRSKGLHRAVLVTDAMSATGSGEGQYALGGLPVTVQGGRVLLTADLAEGKSTLAGSILTMDQAVANLKRMAGLSLSEAIRPATAAPAAMLGRPELARIAQGLPANLNRFNAEGKLIATYLRGQKVQRDTS